MKKILLFGLALLSLTAAKAAPASHRPVVFDKPSATFDSIWVDYDITENDMFGMRIHLKFTCYEMKDIDSYVAIYYEYNDEYAGWLKDKDGKFNSTDGYVALYRSLKPAYDPAVYDDLTLFMPYKQLDLEPGVYDLRMDIKLIYKEGGQIDHLTYYDFDYSKKGSPADLEEDSTNDTKITFDDMWVDYGVMQDGENGMRIHLKFSASNMKDVDAYAVVYFEMKNGDPVKGKSSTYRSKNGQLAVYKSIKPAYDVADYKDLQLFIPYSQFDLGTGKVDLKMDADIIFPSGDLIKHLNFKDFWFER
jgi:hypothetical protein